MVDGDFQPLTAKSLFFDLPPLGRTNEHHQRQDFKSEVLELLRRRGIELDENEAFQ